MKLYDMPNYYLKRTFWYLKHWLRIKAIFTWCCFFRSNDQMQIDLNVDDNVAKEHFFNLRFRFHLISLDVRSFYVFQWKLFEKQLLHEMHEWWRFTIDCDVRVRERERPSDSNQCNKSGCSFLQWIIFQAID